MAVVVVTPPINLTYYSIYAIIGMKEHLIKEVYVWFSKLQETK